MHGQKNIKIRNISLSTILQLYNEITISETVQNVTRTRTDHLIPGLCFFFFVSERVDLTASWSCFLRSSVLVLVCTYSNVPATDESTSGSHFL